MANSAFSFDSLQLVEISLEKQTASNDPNLDFTTGIDDTYISYLFKAHDVVPATDGAALRLRFSDDGGATFEAGASDYQWGRFRMPFTGASNEGSDAADSAISFGGTIGSTANERMHGNCEIFNPSNGNHISCWFEQTIENSSSVSGAVFGGGIFVGNTNAIDGFRLLMDSGNISSGTFELIGIRSDA